MTDPVLKPDLSLLRFFPDSERREQGYPPVSVTEFKQGPFCLYYINAAHFFNKEDNDKKLFPMDTVTHQTVLQAFNKLKFNAVVMEMCGQPRELYPTYIAEAEALARAKPPMCHEMQLSIVLARANGLPLINAERPESEMYEELRAEGYSLRELQAYWILHLQKQLVGEEKDMKAFDATIDRITESLVRQRGYPKEERLTAKEYEAWYRNHYPHRRHPLHAKEGDALAERPEKATAVQLLANRHGELRDRYAIQQITGMLQAYQRVLVVYGAHHMQTQKPVFDAMLAPGEERILVPAHPRTKTAPTAWGRSKYRNVPHPDYRPLVLAV